MFALSDTAGALWGVIVTQFVTLAGLFWNRQRNKHESNQIKDQVAEATTVVTQNTPSANDLTLVRSDLKVLQEAITNASASEALWRRLFDDRLNQLDEHVNRLYAITGARRAAEMRRKQQD